MNGRLSKLRRRIERRSNEARETRQQANQAALLGMDVDDIASLTFREFERTRDAVGGQFTGRLVIANAALYRAMLEILTENVALPADVEAFVANIAKANLGWLREALGTAIPAGQEALADA